MKKMIALIIVISLCGLCSCSKKIENKPTRKAGSDLMKIAQARMLATMEANFKKQGMSKEDQEKILGSTRQLYQNTEVVYVDEELEKKAKDFIWALIYVQKDDMKKMATENLYNYIDDVFEPTIKGNMDLNGYSLPIKKDDIIIQHPYMYHKGDKSAGLQIKVTYNNRVYRYSPVITKCGNEFKVTNNIQWSRPLMEISKQ